VVKRHGRLLALAKISNADLNEAEFTDLIKREAIAKGMSFEAFYSSPESLEIRQAHRLSRGF
jgi:hypothetical protein